MTVRGINTPNPISATLVVGGMTYELTPPEVDEPGGYSSLTVSGVPICEMDGFTFQVVAKASSTLSLHHTQPIIGIANREDIYPAISGIQVAVHAEVSRRERLIEANRINRGLVVNSLLFMRQQITLSGVPAVSFSDCFGPTPQLVDLTPMVAPIEGKYACVSGITSVIIHMTDPGAPDSFRFDALWVTVKKEQPDPERSLTVLKAAHREYQTYLDTRNLSQSPTTPSSK